MTTHLSAHAETGASMTEQADRRRMIRRVAYASMIGSTVEWYDFIIYGVMAGLIFNKQYFPVSNPVVALLISYGTFGAGFLARPLGGIVLGHFGDRVGRKAVLVLTLTLMGASTVLIGAVPTYASIGIAAPVALIALRLVQGFALGGEWGGAILMAFEYAGPKERGFYTAFPQLGLAAGLFISSAVVALLTLCLSGAAFNAWGWRLAFFASAILLALGLFIRLQIVETPEFRSLREHHAVAKAPIAEVIGQHGRNLMMGWGSRAAEGTAFTIYSIFSISYFTQTLHIGRQAVMSAIAAAALVLGIVIPLAARWSDHVDRRRFFACASIVTGLTSFPLFWMMTHAGGHAWIALTALVLGLGLFMAPLYGAQPALFCELFQTRVRYTGISLVYQLGGLLFVSTGPGVAVYLFARNHGEPWLLATYLTMAGGVSAICTLMMRRNA
ncbi:MAG TPA: MFS transporter [Paraburkholderia sp.]|jgi:MFS family permease